ncbi:hypothetical protein C5D18_01165 [Rathayibacter tritici]|nr:hypothetical protein C5D18_01165 [Rathayibacter tritici]
MLNIHLMGTGPFADAVATRLQGPACEHWDGSRGVYDSTNWPRARARVLISAERDNSAEQHVEDVAWGTLQPWIPVQLEARDVRVGPVVTPGRGACLRCFDRRQEQHGRRNHTDLELDKAPSTGMPFRGYTPAHAAMAAAVINTITASDKALTEAASKVWRFGFSELSVRQAVVIPVSGCSRCDSLDSAGRRSARLSRFFAF